MTILCSAALLAAASVAPPAAVPPTGQSLQAWSTRVGNNANLDVRATGTPGEFFSVFASETSESLFYGRSAFLARGVFGANGTGSVTVPFAANVPANFSVSISVVSRNQGALQVISQALPLSGNGGTLCQEFDPNYALGPIEPAVGETLGAQWDLVGMTVSAVNNNPANPQSAIIFDSANPTGGDDDLATPGPGPGNTEAYGQLIIIAENDIDADTNGLVDEPDDEETGGTIRFDFADPYRMCSATLVDIDDQGPSEMRFYIGDSMTLETIPVPFQGDNGVQTLNFDKRDVRRFELVLGGSGGIARLQMVPCPLVVNFDETPFGRPLNLAAGTWITDQFASLGLNISAVNNVAGHPDKAILFDSENPTGEDPDLSTPGSGANNDEPLGLVLIIAEDDVDIDGDGLVDDPDDEQGGGQITFEFDETVTFFTTRVLDVDGMERDVFRFFDLNGNLIDILEIGSLGDNSVQDLANPSPIPGVKSIEVNLIGSGAIARLRWCPDSNVGL